MGNPHPVGNHHLEARRVNNHRVDKSLLAVNNRGRSPRAVNSLPAANNRANNPLAVRAKAINPASNLSRPGTPSLPGDLQAVSKTAISLLVVVGVNRIPGKVAYQALVAMDGKRVTSCQGVAMPHGHRQCPASVAYHPGQATENPPSQQAAKLPAFRVAAVAFRVAVAATVSWIKPSKISMARFSPSAK